MKLIGLFQRARNRYRRTAGNLLFRRTVLLRNSVPLISFTFDDFPRSALQVGGAILNHYGFAGTYYASLGLMEQNSPVGRIFSMPDVLELWAAGHELGCHTFSHLDAWKTPSARFEQSIIENSRALHDVSAEARFRTMSFPISCPRPQTKQRVQKHFVCCRGGGQAHNVHRADLNNLRAFFLEQSRGRADLVKALVDRTCHEKGWLIFATHDISNEPSRFGCTPDFFEEIVSYVAGSGARVLTVAAAAELIGAPKTVPQSDCLAA